MAEPNTHSPLSSPIKPTRRGTVIGIAAALLLGVGGLFTLGQGAASSILTPITPTPIASLRTSGAIAAKGDVAEIYGNKFILRDQTGRALIDTGPDGDGGNLVKTGETIAVQGRFDDGAMRAALLIRADGTRVALGPVAPRRLDRLKDRLGLGPKPDVAGLRALVQSAGYRDIRIAGRGPHHLDVVARGADGKDKDLHVDFDGRIRDAETF